tara:strand:+ start:5052 stop:6575 length:1524 start_codon:yes stop_codon:yes gene_type:complete
MPLDFGNSPQFGQLFNANFSGGGADPGGSLSLTDAQIKSLSSSLTLNFNDNTSGRDISDAVLRVAFSTTTNPYLPYIGGLFSVQQGDNGTKMFVGGFETDFQDTIFPMQLPLIGQSLQELSVSIGLVDGVRAEVLNGRELLDAKNLIATTFYSGTDRWVYFFAEIDVFNEDADSTLSRNIKTFLTSVEPNLSQNIPTQSLGGFISPTEVYTTDVLDAGVSFYDTEVVVTNDNLSSFGLIQIQDEILTVDDWNDGTAVISERQSYGTPIRFHPAGSVVRGLKKNDLFDTKFSKTRKQYRCIAIRNETSNEYAKDVKVYFNLLSRNLLSNTRLAIEIPRSEFRSGTASSGSATFFADSSLSNTFLDDHYVTAAVTFTSGANSGQTRIVVGYNGESGTFFLDSQLPNSVNSGDNYYVDTAPSQRIVTGEVAPEVGIFDQPDPVPPYLIGDFQEAQYFVEGVSIDVDGRRANGGTLGPKQAIYVWIERSLEDINEEFTNNRMFVTVGYSRV